MIAGPDARILYSGDQQAYETHRATLAALADTKWTGTDPSALYDLALLTGMYGMLAGLRSGELMAPFQELLDRAVADGHAADGMSAWST